MNTLRRVLGAVSVDWWANAFIFAATVIIANRRPVEGFALSIVGQILFIIYGLREKRWSFAVFNFFYMFNSFWGIARWAA